MNGTISSDSTSVSSDNSVSRRRQGLYWIGTIPESSNWQPTLPEGVRYLRGQLERGNGGLIHNQIFFITRNKASLRAVQRLFEPAIGHWELTRSNAAEDYVWKEDTRIGEPYEFGERPINRSAATDWDLVRRNAIAGTFEDIPSDIYVRHYGSLRKIHADNVQPISMVRTCSVFWGPTGTGKSRRAWELAGISAYSKDPRTKFWCGYQGQRVVVLDEFRGSIDISHLLRWLDRYPVRVETKGGSQPLMADTFYITSNLPPAQWYPELDPATYRALERRLVIELME